MLYISLFFFSFLAATLLPFSSEAMLLAALAQENVSIVGLWLAASVGNILGALLNWALGRYARHFQDRKWFPFKEKEIGKAEGWFKKFGVWSLFFSFVPVIGDPLTFVAGLLRIHWGLFLALVASGKALRYALVIGLFNVWAS